MLDPEKSLKNHGINDIEKLPMESAPAAERLPSQRVNNTPRATLPSRSNNRSPQGDLLMQTEDFEEGKKQFLKEPKIC